MHGFQNGDFFTWIKAANLITNNLRFDLGMTECYTIKAGVNMNRREI